MLTSIADSVTAGFELWRAMPRHSSASAKEKSKGLTRVTFQLERKGTTASCLVASERVAAVNSDSPPPTGPPSFLGTCHPVMVVASNPLGRGRNFM